MREIEARIIEILAEHGVSAERAITASDVEAIDLQLGSPSDFVDESQAISSETLERNKRLMRDTDRGLLGGVCAGIANYFGFDEVWARLIGIVLILLSFGTAIFVYAVLWIVIPPAKTIAEKLQMHGAPITLAALKENSREAVSMPERSKPLVVALRVPLGLGFVMMTFGAMGLIITTIFVREPLFNRAIHTRL